MFPQVQSWNKTNVIVKPLAALRQMEVWSHISDPVSHLTPVKPEAHSLLSEGVFMCLPIWLQLPLK